MKNAYQKISGVITGIAIFAAVLGLFRLSGILGLGSVGANLSLLFLIAFISVPIILISKSRKNGNNFLKWTGIGTLAAYGCLLIYFLYETVIELFFTCHELADGVIRCGLFPF
ncbi:hypothetical protein A2755_03410 [Candidatus Wolfebacteria bacterium RIFCSPHIGHO2_01_FULL_48_22]|uniref:Uncharacterized protein n=2 Tax=Candidatus Wolfeibacteriota TaxID=1752735 RepID=A0A1F8DRX6_9BACT|nr:MAG: hypothetical protein A2755_03410 [Candidatus Wolfebacteria bacterium RIFCSPHIGHO2_01_FULL_48_22]OGM92075.1 MAG: hypothetical protein A2935_01900 [Candidatus Wolfebacteria bacterium RIFCSPLOWO2_01_FULL_47_17b]